MTTLAFSIRDLRLEKGWTLARLAEEIGSASAGYASAIERGGPCSVKIALRIEELSDGRIPAGFLHPDVAMVERARGLNPPLAEKAA